MVLLVDSSVETDPAAFFRQYYADLYGYVSARTGAVKQDVEDIVQETLLRAWNDRNQFRGESSPQTWITSIAKTRVLDWFRKSGRSREVDGLDKALLRIGDEDLPENVLESAELGVRIRSALRALPENYRALLLQRYVDGKSIKSIAETLGDSEAAVDSRVRRAREALRIFLQTGGSRDE